jgi:hypothetical protein
MYSSSPQFVPPGDAPEIEPCKDRLRTSADLFLEKAQSHEAMRPEEIDAFVSQLRVAEDYVRGYIMRAMGSDLEFMSTLKHSYQQQKHLFTALYARKLSEFLQHPCTEGLLSRLNSKSQALETSRAVVQQNTSDICTLYSQAAKWKPRIDDEIRSIMTSFNADQQVEVMLPLTLKHPFRAMEKITFATPEPETHVQANKLLDVVRGMIVCDSVASMLAVFQQVLSSDMLQIVRLKNRLVQPTDGGWGDCLLSVVLKEDRIERHVFEL